MRGWFRSFLDGTAPFLPLRAQRATYSKAFVQKKDLNHPLPSVGLGLSPGLLFVATI
jgi:hypothetical protein